VSEVERYLHARWRDLAGLTLTTPPSVNDLTIDRLSIDQGGLVRPRLRSSVHATGSRRGSSCRKVY
jgi:hypothetical protein